MQTYIEIILLGYIFSLIFTREFLLCAHGRVGQTQLPYWRRISQSEIRNSAAAEKNWNRKARAGKNSFPPQLFEPEGSSEPERPPSFLPARQKARRHLRFQSFHSTIKISYFTNIADIKYFHQHS